MLSFGQKVISGGRLRCSSRIQQLFPKRFLGEIPRNPNRPTQLSIQTLKAYAASQDNMPVRLSLANFVQSELPLRFAVTVVF